MCELKSARAFCAPVVIAIILLGSMGASALTAWKETASDFPSGENLTTTVDNGSLALDMNNSLATNWTKVGDASNPPQRYRHSMVYDPADGIHILFGGVLDDQNLKDTWIYNLSMNKWTARSPASIMAVGAGYAVAFDTRNGVAVMFGGSLDGIGGKKTQSYDPTLDRWTNENPDSSPLARGLHSMAYDPGTGHIVLFGGRYIPSGSNFTYLGDTWTYTLTNNTWTNRTSGTGPSPRCGQSMCYDAATGLIVLYGGMNDTTSFKDTWTYNPSTNIWTYCNPTVAPPARSGAAMAADASGASVILYGGQSASTMLQDTWSYSATDNTWTQKALGNQPSPRWGAAMTCDRPSGKLFYFGGQIQGGEIMDDFGSYDHAQNSWAKLGELTAPTPRTAAGAAFDNTRGIGVLFGGSADGNYFNDTWTYNLSANRWTRRHPASSPPGRNHVRMCYDQDDGLVVLFGGFGREEFLDDTWTYSVQSNTWSERQPVPSPPIGSESRCMAYDPNSHLVIYFGGDGSSNETWTYNVTANLWTNRTDSVAPAASYDSAMVYDEASRLIVLFGQDAMSSPIGETWILNTSTFTWTQKSPLSSPSNRYSHALVYDSTLGAALLYGGISPINASRLGDTWAYNVTTDNWTNLLPAVSPSPRSGSVMFYDSNMNAAVLFGGWDGNSRGDSWLFGASGRYTSGTYTCAPKDTGGSAYFGNLLWESAAPAGTSVKLQLRSGATQADMESKGFTGPDDTPGTFFDISGQRIPSMHNGSRWVQYRAYLASDSLLLTPKVSSVTVNFNLLQDITITSPAGGENWTDQQSINWSAADPDSDPLMVNVYLLNDSGGKELLATAVPAGDGTWMWDTTTVPNGTYRIMVVARDGNPTIPLEANGTSNEFQILHSGTGPSPGTNHPPTVVLRFPIDGASLVIQPSSTVKLGWNGSDADGDPINYTVYISNMTFNMSSLPPPTELTNRSFFDAFDLKDNNTYHWTVIASDGKATGNGSIWKFAVKFGALNFPPRIISTPPANATVGVEMVYQLSAADENGDPITYTIKSNIAGMVIDPSSGRLTWTPRPSQAGDVTVLINASDGQGGFAEQRFTLFVSEPAVRKPTCVIQSPSLNDIVRGRFRVNGTAINGSFGIVRVQVRVDGRDWMDAGWAAGNWSLEVDTRHLVNGPHIIEARAFDGRNYSDPDPVHVHVRNPERDFDTTWSPAGFVMLLVLLGAAIFLLWHLMLRKGGPPPLR